MKACEPLHPRGEDRHILVGDLNVAPHENDVWSHKQLLKSVPDHRDAPTSRSSSVRIRLGRAADAE